MRKPVAVITITIPLEGAEEFHDPKEMQRHLQTAVQKAIYPEDALVSAFYTWVPDPTKDSNYWVVQHGFNEEAASPEDRLLFEE
jgi:hypothetical protein